ncbi:hypothetical protein ACGFSI_13995 [Streptomyces virginiae]|uniref:hypothetical protein n=1 Tax=Streptomyces virginiae TaxID=1961 RepID=UPI0037220963
MRRASPTGTGSGVGAQNPPEGFDVAVDRVFVQGGKVQGGKEVERETTATRCTPRDHVTCGA